MESSLPSIMGLVGAVVGALVSLLAVYLAQRSQKVREDVRWDREQHVLFHRERREIYGRFYSSLLRLDKIRRDLLEHSEETHERSYVEQLQHSGALLPKAYREMNFAHAELQLIATTDVRKAARVAREVIESIEHDYFDNESMSDWPPTLHALRVCAEMFLDVARIELGIDKPRKLSLRIPAYPRGSAAKSVVVFEDQGPA